LSLRSDNLDSVGELYTKDDFWQLAVAIEAPPASLSVFAELEDHCEPGLLGKTSLELTMRWRTVANELSMVVVVRGCFQCLAGKS
jgi:hypothetical protein